MSSLRSADGFDVEFDWVAGLTRTVARWELTGTATYFAYAGQKSLNYAELTGRAKRAVGAASLAAVVGYAPKQGRGAPKRGLYGGLEGELPLRGRGINATVSVGLEDNAFFKTKVDWSVGLAGEPVRGYRLSAAYVGSSVAAPEGGSAIVLGLKRVW